MEFPVKELYVTHEKVQIDKEYAFFEGIKLESASECDMLNLNATEDESMAVEALRQLGNSTNFASSHTNKRIETKTAFDLPLLLCSLCNLEFRTTADLQCHSAICKHSRHKCQICSEVFDKKGDLNNHLVCHAVDRPHSCRLCGTLFIYKRDLIEHVATHGTAHVNQCQICGVKFSRPSSLTNHMKIHSYQPGRAIVAASLKSPQNETVTKSLPSLNKWDMSYKEAENLDISKQVYDEFNIEQELYANKEDDIEETKSDQEKSFDKLHVCSYCRKSFNREKALMSHLKLHEVLLDNTPQCEQCEKYFTDESALRKHFSKCVQQKSASLDITEEGSNSLIPAKCTNRACNECNKSFSTKQKLQRHMWIHRKKVYTCEICSITFYAHEQLDSHRLAKHQGISAYNCTECGKNFSSRQGLWEHSRSHSSAPLRECTECNKTFSSRQGYLIHKRKHSDERPYGCRFCWKAFRDGGTLRKHELIHTGERPHACPLCNRAFNQKVVLREHVRWLHTANNAANNDGKFDCSICNTSVADKDELCAHIVKHSDQMATLAKDASKSNIKEKSCNVNMEDKGNEIGLKDLKDYLNTVVLGKDFEGEEYEIECEMCGMKFLNKSDLLTHVRIHI